MELGGVGQGAARFARHRQVEPLGLSGLVLLLQCLGQSQAAIVLEAVRRETVSVRRGNSRPPPHVAAGQAMSPR